MASWLAPLIDEGKIHLDGYVPQSFTETEERTSSCPLNLMVFQCEKGRHLLEKAEPKNDLEALHQTVLHAYQDAQSYRKPELILGLAKGLQPLEKQELLPETRLLLALLPRLAHEAQASQGMRTHGQVPGIARHPDHRPARPSPQPDVLPAALAGNTRCTNRPIRCSARRLRKGEAVVEEVNESGSVPNLAVTNKCKRPLLIPEGEILIGAKQNRVINVTVLVAAGVKFVLPVSCVEAGRWRYKSRHFESKFCAPPSLRNKKLRAVHRNRSAGGVAASDQGEVWDEVQACLDGVQARSETASLTDAFGAAEETLEGTLQTLGVARGGCGRSGWPS